MYPRLFHLRRKLRRAHHPRGPACPRQSQFQCEEGHCRHVGQGRRRQEPGHRLPGRRRPARRQAGRHPGRRRHRPLHPQGLWGPRPGHGGRQRHPSRPHPLWAENDVPQPPDGERDRPGGLAGGPHRRDREAILDRRAVGRRGLYVRGYASRNRRRAPHRVPIPPGGWYYRGHLPPGPGKHDRGEGGKHGRAYEPAHSGSCGKLQLL